MSAAAPSMPAESPSAVSTTSKPSRDGWLTSSNRRATARRRSSGAPCHTPPPMTRRAGLQQRDRVGQRHAEQRRHLFPQAPGVEVATPRRLVEESGVHVVDAAGQLHRQRALASPQLLLGALLDVASRRVGLEAAAHAAAAQASRGHHLGVADLAAQVRGARVELATEDDAGADAGADVDAQHVAPRRARRRSAPRRRRWRSDRCTARSARPPWRAEASGSRPRASRSSAR